ncbi:MAG: SMC-Scp complex subunit ScpB [Pseudomonadota bacterium]
MNETKVDDRAEDLERLNPREAREVLEERLSVSGKNPFVAEIEDALNRDIVEGEGEADNVTLLRAGTDSKSATRDIEEDIEGDIKGGADAGPAPNVKLDQGAPDLEESILDEEDDEPGPPEPQFLDDDDLSAEEGEATGENLDPAMDPIWAAAQMVEQARMVEALLFASPAPLDKAAIARRLPEGADIPALLEALTQQYENRGIVLTNTGGKYSFITHPDVAHVLREHKSETRRLSRAALETLAIIAYHQPCTRADIEDVRGVAVSKGSLDQLLEVGWVRLRGRRRDAPGRPVLYGTSDAFLEHFNLESVGDLPGMADLKAAGLLDARLPPGFSIPTPQDAGDDETETDDDGSEEDPEFVQDFHGEAEVTAEAVGEPNDADGDEEVGE